MPNKFKKICLGGFLNFQRVIIFYGLVLEGENKTIFEPI